MCGQLGHVNSPVTVPQEVKVQNNVLNKSQHGNQYVEQSSIIIQYNYINYQLLCVCVFKLSEGLQVWDVSAGQSHSLLLADGDSVQPVLLYCGQHQQPTPVHNKKPHQSQRSSQRSPRRAESYTVRPIQLPVYMEVGTHLNSFSFSAEAEYPPQ